MKNNSIKDYTEAGFNELGQREDFYKPDISRQSFKTEDNNTFNLLKNRNLRTAKTGTTVIAAGATEVEIDHNLGYNPSFLVYAKVIATGFPNAFLNVPYFKGDGVANPRIVASINKSKLTVTRSFITGRMTVRYFIYEDNLDNK